MHNTIDVLPIGVQPQVQQPRKSSAASTQGCMDFSEAIGSATDRANDKPGGNTIAKDETGSKPISAITDTEEEQQPAENEIDVNAAEQLAAGGYANIQQMMAGLVIDNANGGEIIDVNAQDAEQPMTELPQRQQMVDVLEGFLTTDMESSEKAQPQVAQPGEQATGAEAWTPTGLSEAKPQQPDQPGADAPVSVEQGIESKLEEHLRPLENSNPTVQEAVYAEKPDGEVQHIDVDNTELNVSEAKDYQKDIDDIQGARSAAEDIVEPDPADSPMEDMRREDGEDADGQTPTMFAANNEVQLPKTGMEQQKLRAEETVFSKMVENITTNAQQGKREFSINLRPDFMGDMNIELVMTEAGLSAKIKAADPQINSLISQQLFKLEQSLKEQGIDVVNLEVSVFDTGEFGKEDFSRHSDNQGDANGKAGRIGRVKAVAQEAIMAAGMETLSESQTVEALGMGSSVEYTA